MAGERHGRGMLCVNRPLLCSFLHCRVTSSLLGPNSLGRSNTVNPIRVMPGYNLG
jgi:hypothetical protein